MQQVREQLVTQALAHIAENGIRVGLEDLSLADMGAVVGVSPAEANSAFADDSGEDHGDTRFREAVAVRILRDQPGIGDTAAPGDGLTETLVALSAVLETMPELDELSPEERGEWLRVLLRAGALANHAMADRSRLWQSYVAISAGFLSQTRSSPALEAAWSHGEQHAAARYLNLYTVVASMFGLRLRYCYTWEQFTTAVSAVSEGLMIRSNVSPHVREVERTTGTDGELETWTLFGVCLEGLVRQFFEADPSAILTTLAPEAAPFDPEN